eukprot:gene6538-13083_t
METVPGRLSPLWVIITIFSTIFSTALVSTTTIINRNTSAPPVNWSAYEEYDYDVPVHGYDAYLALTHNYSEAGWHYVEPNDVDYYPPPYGSISVHEQSRPRRLMWCGDTGLVVRHITPTAGTSPKRVPDLLRVRGRP